MISFIIPAHNEEQLLPATLAAIHEVAWAAAVEYEIVVVDDASTDQTAAIAAANGARVVTVGHRQIAATRNAGAGAANGDLLVFVDADTIVSRLVLAAVLRAVEEGAVGGGAPVEFDGRAPLYARILLPVLLLLYSRVARWAGGCFVFCTRTAFDATGGFDERLFASEEIGFSRALKREGRFVILPYTVITSGRKFRTYSGWTVLATLGRLLVGGRSAVRSREALDLWYRDRETPATGWDSDAARKAQSDDEN